MKKDHAIVQKNEVTILLCIAGLLKGGAEKQFVTLARGLVQNGNHVVIHILGGEHLVQFGDLFSITRDIHFSNVTSKQKLFAPFILVKDVIRLVRTYKPDVVYASLFIAGCIVRLAKVFGLLRTKVIISIRNDFLKSYHWYEKIAEYFLYYFGDGVICNGKQSIYGFQNRWRKRVYYIPNGINPGEYSLSPKRKMHNKETIRFLNVGRLIIRNKNQLALVDALKKLKKAYSNREFSCVLLGEERRQGNDQKFIEERIAAAGLSENIQLRGKVNNVYQYYMDSDILIHNSVVEGFPNVVLEAMLAGLPVIFSRYMGGLEIIEDGVHGFIAEDNGADSLFEAIKKMVDLTSKERQEMGNRARELVFRKYTNETMVENHIQLFKQLIRK